MSHIKDTLNRFPEQNTNAKGAGVSMGKVHVNGKTKVTKIGIINYSCGRKGTDNKRIKTATERIPAVAPKNWQNSTKSPRRTNRCPIQVPVHNEKPRGNVATATKPLCTGH